MSVERRFERSSRSRGHLASARARPCPGVDRPRRHRPVGFRLLHHRARRRQPNGEMTRRVLLGYDHAITRERKKRARLEGRDPHRPSPPELRGLRKTRTISRRNASSTGSARSSPARRTATRPASTPNAWHERDSLCLVLRDSAGEMIGYLSPDVGRRLHPLARDTGGTATSS